MKNLRLILATIFVVILGIQPSYARGIDGKSFTYIANQELEVSKKIFSNKTLLMKRIQDSYRKHSVAIPVKGTFVAYLQPNGRALVWAKDAKKIIAGSWWVGLNRQKDKKRRLFCLNLASKEKYVTCYVIKYMDRFVFDSEKGNIFNLRNGGKVPGQLPFARSLSTVKNKMK